MIATKEFQTDAVQEVEILKAEKNALIKRKVSSMFVTIFFFPGLPLAFGRKLSMAKSPPSQK